MIPRYVLFVLELVLFLVGVWLLAFARLPLGSKRAIVARHARWIGWWLALALPASLGLRVLVLAVPIHLMGKKEFAVSWTQVSALDVGIVVLLLLFAGIGLFVFPKVGATDARYFRAAWGLFVGLMTFGCIGLAGTYIAYLSYHRALRDSVRFQRSIGSRLRASMRADENDDIVSMKVNQPRSARHGPLDEEDLCQLQRLPKLRELTLQGPLVFRGAGLASLRDVPMLRRLELFGSGIRDGHCEQLAQLQQLRELAIWQTQLTDDGLDKVSHLKVLERLSLKENKNITDAGIAHLRRLENLRSLQIHEYKVTSASLTHLTMLPSLEKLQLQIGGLDALSVEHIRSMKKLKELELSDSRRHQQLRRELEVQLPELRVFLRPR